MSDKVTASPLNEPNPRSLDELFDADPLSLSERDLADIVSNLRENREKWMREESESKTQGRARRPTTYKEPPKKGQLNLALLGLTPKAKK